MSAFVISEDCMRRAVRAICTRTQYGQIVGGQIAQIDVLPENASEIGRALYAMNIEAVEQRYPDTIDNPDNMPGPCDDNGKSTARKLAQTFTCNVSASPIWPVDEIVAGYKALNSLMYQCAEGDVPETVTYKQLSAASDAIAAAIVRRLPAYNEAPWA